MKITWVIVAVLLPLVPGAASAQATTVEELSKYLRKGEAIEVTIDGHKTRGIFDSASPSGLALRNNGRVTLYPAERVQRVTRKDGIENGTAIGLGAGLAAGFIVALRMSPNRQRCLSAVGPFASQFEGCGDNRASAFRTLTTIGVVAGAAIDGFMKDTLYESRPGTGQVSIRPVLGWRRQGLTASIAF
jgi:hypothetical protein